MKKIFRKVSAAVTALAVMFTAVFVFGVPETAARAATVVLTDFFGKTNPHSLRYVLDSDGVLTIKPGVAGSDGLMPDFELSKYTPWNEYRGSDNSVTIKSIIIEPGVKSIGECAFGGCENVTSITIPESVTSIGEYAFASCESVTNITIPESVTSIGESAFQFCKYLDSIEINAKITNIRACTFFGCENLKSVTIPDTVTTIELQAFDFTGLTSLTLPKSVTVIGARAFGSTKLKQVFIPKTVKEIYSLAFCDVERVDFESHTPVSIKDKDSGGLTKDPFHNVNAIYVPCIGNAVEAYKAQDGFSLYTDKIYAYHKGGTATCTEKATCEVCGEKYGGLAAHKCGPANCSQPQICTVCGTKVSDAGYHRGGTATCKEPATCEICGQKYGNKTDNHDFEEIKKGSEPTCTREGATNKYGFQVCRVCGVHYGLKGAIYYNNKQIPDDKLADYVVDKRPHSTRVTNANEATCTVDGNIEYWKCSSCNHYFSDSSGKNEITQEQTVIKSTGHSWSTDWESDSTNHWKVCSTCGAENEKNTHNWDDGEVAIDATCTAEGTKVFRCTTCRAIKTETIAVTGHSWGTSWSSDDTNHWHTCNNSGCNVVNDKAAHEGGAWTLTTEPTLTTTGAAEHACSCGKTDTANIPKLTDTTVWTKGTRTEPTLKGTGSQKYTSTDYGTVTITVPKLTDETVWTKGSRTEPTLNGTGSQKYTSTDYGTVTITVPKLTDTTVWTKGTRTEPTLNGTGSQKYTSTDYGTVTITIPKLTDTTVWTKGTRTEPTLKNTGSQKYTSTDYGTVTITIPKLTDDTVWTKGDRTEPTLNSTGSQKYTSTDYGKVTITIPALNDETVWAKDDMQHVDATDEEDGKDVYTSPDYGEVTVILTALGHTHEWGDWEITKAPAKDEEGTAKRVCTKNDAHTETKTLPVLTDTSVWTKDNNKHVEPTEQAEGKDVYTSEYGEVTVTLGKLPHEHRLAHVDEVPATEDKEGVKAHWHCNGCGKDFFDEHGSNEATADALKIGKIETEVQAPANVPKPEIATPKEELIAAALTQEEQEKVKDGTDIKIILKIEDASDSAPAEDKEKIDTAIGGLEDHKLGLYLDITLLKKIGELEHEAITNTSKPIAVTFEIPEALRGMAKYSVIRIHNGETTVLEDEDSDPDTITVKTDKFSTYALIYQDKAAVSDPSGDDTSNSDSSDAAPSESDNSDVMSSEDNSGSSDTTSSGNGASTDKSDTNSSGGTSSSDESNHAPSESSPSENDGNPSTGISVSLVPLTAVLAAVIAAAKRKKK